MEGELSDRDSRAPLLARPLWPSRPLPDGGEAAGVALKHVGIVEHRSSEVSPSRRPPLLCLNLGPNSLGHGISRHRGRRIWAGGAAGGPRMLK